MKLTGFTNWKYRIRGYYITNTSAAFKKRFPKKYIVISIERNEVFNEDKLESIPISLSDDSLLYFFTTDTKFYNSKETQHSIEYFESAELKTRIESLKVFPVDLSRYLMNASLSANPAKQSSLKTETNKDEENDSRLQNEDNDLVIKLEPIDTKRDPRLMTSIVLRCSSSMLMQSKIKETLNKLIELGYHDFKPAKTAEEWFLTLVEEIPFNFHKQAFHFPNVIDDKLFKQEFKPNLDNFLVTYSSRGRSIKDEIELARYLENELSSYNGDITIVNDYTNIVPRIEGACKKKKLSYKRDGLAVTLKMKDFYSLDLDFELINFLQ